MDCEGRGRMTLINFAGHVTNGVGSKYLGGAMKLKRKYAHIRFNLGASGIWWCHSVKGDDLLGSVDFFEKWRQWCFYPVSDTVHSSTCLSDIADFLRQLNDGDKPKVCNVCHAK